MSVIEYDVIIIGAGVAGLTAGAFLAERGFKVALVTTGEPTACLSTGCIDVCSRDNNPLRALMIFRQSIPITLCPEKIIRECIELFSDGHDGYGNSLCGRCRRKSICSFRSGHV